MRYLRPPMLAVLLTGVGAALFAAASAHWASGKPAGRGLDPRLQVVPPPATAVALAFGDRYLAGDLAGARAMVAGSNLEGPEEQALFARLLDLSSRLNPAHEDTYYLSEAYLPWQDRLDQAQTLLGRAGEARPWDWLPPFFRAFNVYYFERRPQRAAEILRQASAGKPAKQAAQMRAIAGKWSALGRDPRQALEMVESMAQGASLPALQGNLQKRAEQLRRVIRLQEAADAYRRQEGQPPPDVASLVGYGGLEAIPEDPMGDGFIVDESGHVRVTPPDLDRVKTP